MRDKNMFLLNDGNKQHVDLRFNAFIEWADEVDWTRAQKNTFVWTWGVF